MIVNGRTASACTMKAQAGQEVEIDTPELEALAPLAGADAVRRGQPFLPRLREERRLQAASARLRIRDDQPALGAFLPRSRRRRLASRRLARPQPLHPVRALRARQPRRRRQERVRLGRARHGIEDRRQFPERPARRQRHRGDRQGDRGLPGRRDPRQARRLRPSRSASAASTAPRSAPKPWPARCRRQSNERTRR